VGGIYVVIPAIRPLTAWLNSELGWIPFFGTSLSGPGLLPAALGTCHHDPADHCSRVAGRAYGRTDENQAGRLWHGDHPLGSDSQGDGAIGCHRHFGSLVLGLGRALGETMALAMLVGNANNISLSLFARPIPWRLCWR
jgi:phosphate transport system permease protein